MTQLDTVCRVESSSLFVIESSSSSAKIASCIHLAADAVLMINFINVLEPAIAALHNIAYWADDGARARSISSASRRHSYQVDMSSEASRRQATLQGLRLRPRKQGHASYLRFAYVSRSCKCFPGPQALLLDML